MEHKQTCRLAIVAPFKELADLSLQTCQELSIESLVGVGDLSEGVTVAKGFVDQGAEVIISRGGTASAIQEALDIPVVPIAVSGFDLVRAVAEAKVYGNRIGVVGFRNVIYGAQSLETIFHVSIREIEIHNADEVPDATRAAQKEGIQVIVGDAVSVRRSKNFGLPAILVKSGKESIGIALREAQEVALIRRKEREKAEQLKVILDSTYEGILSTDKEGKISLVNQAAEKILGLKADRLISRPVREALPGFPIERVQITGKTRLGNLYRFGSRLLVQNIVPVVIDQQTVGVVSTFQEASDFQAMETKVRQKIHLKGHVTRYTFDDMITDNGEMKLMIERARKFSGTEATILIQGETGTGKEVLAQSIHNASRRKEQLFVAINCAAVPENLLESELFGYEEGAFTGARKGGKQGLFELAHKGTLFLDEVGELSLNLQARLLRVLQQKAVMRVGGDQLIPVDVRIIAATHRNLKEAVDKGDFRRDFYYRLNVLELAIPPLRERLTDIELLVRTLISSICQRGGYLAPAIGKDIFLRLQKYDWPGNVRELENVLERLIVLKQGTKVEISDIDEVIGKTQWEPEALQLWLKGTLQDMEQEIIRKTLELTNQDKEETCRLLGLSKTTLWRRLKTGEDISC